MKTNDLSRLSAIARMMRDRELAKVEGIVAHMNRLRADIARIEEARDARSRDTGLDAARLLGADVAWLAATEEQLTRAQAQMAMLRVTHENALREARRAFGRSDVLGTLSDDAAAKARRPKDPDD
ncbi:hypothetical protein LX81_02668 [Palleronia aestuarii]|uniref:Flagellar export protein FliJ n=1 Tax=Palleronia aestuarii TaxID=568105 RepID=A0A2W7PZX6_9RHOB|nr:hypothetical protein [Palleronia aestuarii]PZX15079.1 hypothetical protein LX81_02668 [Palleronia aestuarii]